MSWRRYALAIVVVVIALLVYQNWIYVRAIYNQPQLFRAPVFDTQAPALPEDLGAVAILSFSKTNGYRHLQSIPASIQMLDELAAENGWQFYHTENAAVFSQENLSRFQLIILNHKSGTVWTDEQRMALQGYVESGGSLIAQHAAGGDQGGLPARRHRARGFRALCHGWRRRLPQSASQRAPERAVERRRARDGAARPVARRAVPEDRAVHVPLRLDGHARRPRRAHPPARAAPRGLRA